MAKTLGRSIFILTDSLPGLSNGRVFFLRPNTTSSVQPMDAGIISSLKVRYRTLKMEHALDLVDELVKIFYELNIVTAMRLMKMVWMEIPSSVLVNCWIRPFSLKCH